MSLVVFSNDMVSQQFVSSCMDQTVTIWIPTNSLYSFVVAGPASVSL